MVLYIHLKSVSLTLVFQVDGSEVYVRSHLSLQLQLLIISEKKSPMKSPKLAFQTGSRCGNPSWEYTDLSRAAFHSIVYAKFGEKTK